MKNNKISCISWALEQEVATRRSNLYQASLFWCHDSEVAESLVEKALANAIDKQSHSLSRKCFVIRLYRLLFNSWFNYITSLADNVEVLAVRPRQDMKAQRNVVFTLPDELELLPVPLSEVLILVDYAGFNNEEIASIVDAPIGTVMSRVFRARKYLREHAAYCQQQENLG